MSTPSLDRVQQDLDLMKSVIPSDFPYDRFVVFQNIACGLWGGMAIALKAFPEWSLFANGILIAMAVVAIAVYVFWLRNVRAARRSVRPRRWSWNKQEMTGSGIALLGVLVYIAAIRLSAEWRDDWGFPQWRDQIAGPVLFAIGLGMVVLGSLQSRRRSMLGWGIAMVGVGVMLPWLSSRAAVYLITGSFFLAGGLASGAILWLQLHRWEESRACN